MPLILPVKGITPKLDSSVWIAENATIVGEVVMGKNCTVWFQAVVRGDVNKIAIGNQVNIQDGVVIHGTFQKSATTIGNKVSIGHNATIHGCTIQDHVLIGMGAIVMDDAIIASHTIIAAGAVVLQNTITEPYSIYAGVPAKKVKTITKEEAEKMISKTADNYIEYASWFKTED